MSDNSFLKLMLSLDLSLLTQIDFILFDLECLYIHLYIDEGSIVA